MALHPAFEEYAEVIWELGEDDLDRIQARVADRLGCSRPAVSEGIRRMERAGLVRRDGRTLRLTADGEQLAVRTVRRHRLAERMLTDVLGVGWAEAHAEAGVWEHVLSDEVTDRLEALLDHPTTCPHGNPIPGASPVPIEDTVPLSEVPVGRRCWIRRVTEQVEHTEGALELLEAARVTPGRTARVDAVGADGTVTVTVADATSEVPAALATRIRVVVGDPAELA